jgi:diguanylate cyclase (GGDEF)-like protein/PAS domain S-box-containing protein
MPYVLIINAAVSLIMGIALVLVWRRDRKQAFTRYIGWANIIQLLVPVSYWLTGQSHAIYSVWGFIALPVAAGAYTTLLLVGAAHLAERPISRKIAWPILLVLVVINAVTINLGGLWVTQIGVATINSVLGVVCAYWLWGVGGRRMTPEKLAGPLLIVLGLIQFIYVVYHDDGAALLATLGALLRMSLGLVILYAALERGGREIRKQQMRFERLTERSLQGIMISLGGTRIVYANPACLELYGVRTLEDLRVVSVGGTIPETERNQVRRIIKAIQLGQKRDATYESLRHRIDGSPLWLRFHYFPTEWDGARAVQILISDETGRHEAGLALAHQASHDELTGLPNRLALIKSLHERCQSDDATVSFVLVLINIDRFKLFNEAHGHSMGDQVLVAMGQALRACVDTSCEVMRLGGDEFALVSQPHASGETAVAMVSAVRKLLSKPFQVSDQSLFLDASMGIALYPDSARDAESLLRAVNAAMQVAKRTPGTSYRLAEKAFERGSSNALVQEQALRAGIEGAELYLTYQPKVDAYTGELLSFEALARWDCPGVGSVSPVEFIAAAERIGLIGSLGTSLLKQACAQIATWHAQYGQCVPVAVNVSPIQMLDPEFPQLVANVLEAAGVAPQWLTLEITESSAVQNMDQTVLQVAQLRNMGVHVAMDDFGTGFSSLNMLRMLRLHTVKIDRGLIDPLPEPDAVAVVRAICQLANALHLHVVAEGIETQAQAHAARDAGCGELQGFLFSKPLLAEDVTPWLESLTLPRPQPSLWAIPLAH